jgi:hypothetical protein
VLSSGLSNRGNYTILCLFDKTAFESFKPQEQNTQAEAIGQFHVGDRVMITGLKAKIILNRKVGNISEAMNSDGRYAVKIDNMVGGAKLVKPANIRKVVQQQTSAQDDRDEDSDASVVELFDRSDSSSSSGASLPGLVERELENEDSDEPPPLLSNNVSSSSDDDDSEGPPELADRRTHLDDDDSTSSSDNNDEAPSLVGRAFQSQIPSNDDSSDSGMPHLMQRDGIADSDSDSDMPTMTERVGLSDSDSDIPHLLDPDEASDSSSDDSSDSSVPPGLVPRSYGGESQHK